LWRSAAAAALTAGIGLAPSPASAFQIETSQTSGCHEGITLDALAQVGWPDGREPPPLDDTDQRIADDLPFDLPAEAEDPWTVALLIGIRHNDVRALDPFDLPGLAVLHGDPARQAEHCLRTEQQDGAQGDALALADCRAFVLGQVAQALIGSDGEVDMDRRILVETHLKFRGSIQLDLHAYPFLVGRALHAIQDSYTHTFRNAATEEIRTVLNWVEGNLDGSSDEERDGHAHVSQLDLCGSTPAQERRRGWAVAASADLLSALAAPAGSRGERLERAAAVFDDHTQREPGCTAANTWCDAPEASLSTSCAAGGGSGAGAACAVLVAILFMGRRRRAGALALALLLAPAAAAAQDEPGPDADPAEQERAEEEEQAERSDTATENSLEREAEVIERLPDPVSETWGAAFNAGVAFDRGAGAVALGLRWNPWRDLGFGLDAEYNPWVSVSGFDLAAGAVSLYVPVIWRLKRFGTWELRSTAYAGATMILFDLVGVDRGTVGVFAGINPLGLALPLGAHAKLVIKPGDIAVSAPQLRGIPFYYLQYRFTFGVEWYP
jgi:hypothetical protein